MKKIAKSTQLTTHDVKAVLRAAWAIAYAEANKNTEVRIPCFEPLKLKHKPTRKAGPMVMKFMKHKPARKAGKKMMFGKEVKVAAKPASKVVKAFPAKALKDSI